MYRPSVKIPGRTWFESPVSQVSSANETLSHFERHSEADRKPSATATIERETREPDQHSEHIQEPKHYLDRNRPAEQCKPPVMISIPTQSPEPDLSAQQKRVLETILNGQNYFFTGSAGTGKSVLLRAVIKALQKRAEEKRRKFETEIEVLGEDTIAWKSGVRRRVPSDFHKPQAKEEALAIEKSVNDPSIAVTASTGMAAV